LCFTVAADRASATTAALAKAGSGATRIGRIVAGSGVRVLDSTGQEIVTPPAGWEHFAR
jgi:thiamine-monophosphate kinase